MWRQNQSRSTRTLRPLTRLVRHQRRGPRSRENHDPYVGPSEPVGPAILLARQRITTFVDPFGRKPARAARCSVCSVLGRRLQAPDRTLGIETAWAGTRPRSRVANGAARGASQCTSNPLAWIRDTEHLVSLVRVDAQGALKAGQGATSSSRALAFVAWEASTRQVHRRSM